MELTDLKYLDWTEQKLSPGTPGCFLKAYEETQNGSSLTTTVIVVFLVMNVSMS